TSVGVASLVMSSLLETPVSLAGTRSGVDGAGGAVLSSTAFACTTTPGLPAASDSWNAIVNEPSASPDKSTPLTCTAAPAIEPEPCTVAPPPVESMEYVKIAPAPPPTIVKAALAARAALTTVSSNATL